VQVMAGDEDDGAAGPAPAPAQNAFVLPPPKEMSLRGDKVENWKSFAFSWKHYRIAAELDKKDDRIQASVLSSIMGRECMRIVENLPSLTEEDRAANPDKIVKELEKYFLPTKNIVRESFQFLKAPKQAENESIQQFEHRLRELIKHCGYNEVPAEMSQQDRMLRDKLIWGARDLRAQERLLRMEAVPTLVKVLETLQSAELSQAHARSLQPDESGEATAHFMSKKRHTKNTAKSNRKDTKKDIQVTNCGNCGTDHAKSKCPAYYAVCRKCQKKGHYAVKCRGKSKKTVHLTNRCTSDSESEHSEDNELHRAYQVNNFTKSKCKIPVKFNTRAGSKVVISQMDTGSTISAMSLRQLKDILGVKKVALKDKKSTLRLYGDHTVKTLGQYDMKISVDDSPEVNVTFDIVESAPWPIIDGKSCIDNGWISVNVETVHMANDVSITADYIDTHFKDIFTGNGCLPGKCHLKVDPNIKPVQHACRRVAVALKPKIKAKIKDMESQNVITKVTEPTDWISSSIGVLKPDGSIRFCLDPKDLNKALLRPKYQMPTLDEVLPDLSKAKCFSVFDAKDSYHQVQLDEESSFLTTFWTPFGRYRYLRMPFGICTASEEYQRRQHEVLEGLEGVTVIADDILVYGVGDTYEEAEQDHDAKLLKLFERSRQVNLKFNRRKMKLKQKSVPYMGNVLTDQGLKPDPSKVEAILEMPPPVDKQGVQRILGSVTYLSRFMPNLTKVSEPLRMLTEDNTVFQWQSQQQKCFDLIKELICSAPILKYYDVNEDVTIECDASSSGLGCTLLHNGQPVAFASRSLSPSEQNYCQMEKECLAIVFSCERFDQYLFGRSNITVETDHKPLISIFKKPLIKAPKRLQLMMLKLQKYELNVTYKPGSQMYIADMLSRAYLTVNHSGYQRQQEHVFSLEIESVNALDYIGMSDSTSQLIRTHTCADQTLQTLMQTVIGGWPDSKESVPISIKEYFSLRDEITVQDGVLFKGQCVIIPRSLRSLMLQKTHNTHLGAAACLRRARDVIFWPGMAAEIKDLVSQCETCNDFQSKNSKEPMMSHPIPQRPWETLSQDLFTHKGLDYLITVDHYSDYFEVDKLHSTTSVAVIKATQRQFARHGIPVKVITDNGPQFASIEYKKFSQEWEFTHITSSPRHPASNGKAESAVKIAKSLIKKAHQADVCVNIALLEWRNTPDIYTNASPVQKLMSRRTRTLLPTTTVRLNPSVIQDVHSSIVHKKQVAKKSYDKTARELPPLHIGENVRMQPLNNKSPWPKGEIVDYLGNKSYVVKTDQGQYRRNRKFLKTSDEQYQIQCSSASSETGPYDPINEEQQLTHQSNEAATVTATPKVAASSQSASVPPTTCVSTPLRSTADTESAVNTTPRRRSQRPSKRPVKYGQGHIYEH